MPLDGFRAPFARGAYHPHRPPRIRMMMLLVSRRGLWEARMPARAPDITLDPRGLFFLLEKRPVASDSLTDTHASNRGQYGWWIT